MKNYKLISFVFAFFIFQFLASQLPIEVVVQRGHQKPLTSMAFSPDGSLLASGSRDNSVKLWSVKEELEIRTFYSHNSSISKLAFNQSGNLLASTSYAGKLVVQDIVTGNILFEYSKKEGDFRDLLWSNNEKTITVSSHPNELLVFDLEKKKLIQTQRIGHSEGLNPNFYDNEKLIIPIEKSYKQLIIKDLQKNDTIASLDFEDYISHAYHPQTNLLLLSTDVLKVYVYNLEQKSITDSVLINSEQECDGCRTKMAMANNSSVVALGNKDYGICVYDLIEKKKLFELDKFEDLEEFQFSKDDKYLLLKGDDHFAVYDWKRKKEILNREIENIDEISLDISIENNLTIPQSDYSIEIFNLEKKKEISRLKGYLNDKSLKNNDLSYDNYYQGWILKLINYRRKASISPNGKWIAKGGVDSAVVIIETSTGKVKKILDLHGKEVYLTLFSPDGKWLATAGMDKNIIIWNTQTWEDEGILEGHSHFVLDINFSKDSKTLISSAWDATVIEWDLEDFSIKSYQSKKNSSVYSLEYLKDGFYVFQGDLNKNNEVLELDTKEVFKNLVGHTEVVSDVLDIENGQLVSSSWDGSVKIWDARTGYIQGKHKSHQGEVLCLAWTSKKKFIYSGASDGKILIYSIEYQKVIDTLFAHQSPVVSLSIDEKEQYLVSQSANGELKVWDIRNNEHLYTHLQLNREDWLVSTQNGYFDGSSKALKKIAYVKGLQVIEVNSLFKKYFTPSLGERVINGERFSYVEGDFDSTVAFIPNLEIRIDSTDNFLQPFEDGWKSKSEKLYVSFLIKAFAPGIFVTHIYNNGKIQSNIYSVRGKQAEENHQKIRLVDGWNHLEFVSEMDGVGTSSKTEQLKIFFDGEKAKPDLFVLAIGVNEYKNPSYKLNFAQNDAQSFLDIFNGTDDSLFNKTYKVFLKNELATKSSIIEEFEEYMEEMGPEDVFIFFFAGHGVMSNEVNPEEREFFAVTYDVDQMFEGKKELKKMALASSELIDWIQKLPAQKQLYILDACQSGGALKTGLASRGGFEREKALARLARSSGVFVLSASQEQQYAHESFDLKHGFFTQSILEAFEGNEYSITQDNQLMINELRTYIESRVPQLTEKYKAALQYPVGYSYGQDFPLILFQKSN